MWKRNIITQILRTRKYGLEGWPHSSVNGKTVSSLPSDNHREPPPTEEPSSVKKYKSTLIGGGIAVLVVGLGCVYINKKKKGNKPNVEEKDIPIEESRKDKTTDAANKKDITKEESKKDKTTDAANKKDIPKA